MKKFLFLILLLTSVELNAQIINRWFDVYNEEGNFNGWYRQNNLQSFDKDNLLLIDQHFANTQPFLAVTNDGGQKWDTIFESKSFEYEINAIAYPSKERIVWVGDSSEYQGSEGYNSYYRLSGVFFTSTDAGKSWNKVQIDTNTMLDYVVMLDENTGIINQRSFSNMYNKNISYWDTLYYSENFFKTYTKIPVPDSLTFVSKIFMFSNNNFIIQTANYSQKKYKYLETTDQGKTWTEFMDAKLTADLFFINRLIAYKIEYKPLANPDYYESLIYKTTNGGIDWIYCFTPTDSYWSTSYRVWSIAAADADNVIAVGSNGAIFRTDDGGINWQKEFTPNISGGYDLEYDNLLYISYPEKNCAYITGGDFVLKMNGEKTLSRPILNRYMDRISPFGIKAFWKPIDGAKKYNIQIANSPGNNVYDYKVFDNPVFDTVVTDTSIVLPDFDFNNCYYGRIKSISDDMESEWTIKASMFCTFQNADYTDPPIFISPLPGTLIDTNYCELKWHSVSEADEYQLQISDDRFYQGNVINQQGSNDTVFKAEDLIPGTKYYARVRVISGSKITNWSSTYFTISDLSSVININFDDGNQISIYPNPAEDYIEISLHNGASPIASDKVQIFDIIGIEVMSVGTGLDLSTQRIDVSGLPAGVYYIRIGDRVEKFVKM